MQAAAMHEARCLGKGQGKFMLTMSPYTTPSDSLTFSAYLCVFTRPRPGVTNKGAATRPAAGNAKASALRGAIFLKGKYDEY